MNKICILSGRIPLAVLWLLVAGCASEQAGIAVAPHDVLEGPARIVSSVVSAGGKSYVVDEMYTPSESNLSGITSGPDGDIWFTGDVPQVGKSSITGDMYEFLLSEYGNATSIAQGPDGNLWVTLYPAAIGRVSTKGDLTAFPIGSKFGSGQGYPFSIVSGPEKALWFVTNASPSYIGRITLAGKMTAYKVPAGARLQWLALGSDGDLWFTDSGNDKIGRMTSTGAVKEFSVPTASAGLSGICQGPDGSLWFVEANANKIGSLSSSGSFHEYNIRTPSSGAVAIVAGPDGALWFTEQSAGKIGRMTTSGASVELTLSSAYPRPFDITVGSDRNVWFTESESYGIMGRVELNNVKDSAPKYSAIALSLRKSRPQLGIAAKLPLSVTAYNLDGHVIRGHYPYPIYLTTSDPKNAGLSSTSVTSSSSVQSVLFSGHYTDATIGANADGGARIDPATVLPSTQPEKPLPHPGESLTTGPKNSLWICLTNGSIAEYSANGAVNVYPATTSFQYGCSMVEGSDGNIWFTDPQNDRIGRITPQGGVTFFGLGSEAGPYAIALGSDGALWFTEVDANEIGRLTTQGALTNFQGGYGPLDIVAGPDGNLWYNDESGNIYKLTTAGTSTRVLTVYEMGGLWVANHNLWFWSASNYTIEEMSTGGTILKKYAAPLNPTQCIPFSLTGGPEGSIWYIDPADDCVARMTLSGKFFVVPTYSQASNPGLYTAIVVGPKGDLWFTESGNSGLGWVDPTTM
jgi:streptogramin lyase